METKDINPNQKTKGAERVVAMVEATDLRVITVVIASSVELNILLESALLMVSSATNAMVKTILAEYVILRLGHSHDKNDKHQCRSKGRPKSKNFTKVVQSDSDNEGHYDDYDDTNLQECDNVETLYYFDVVISSSEQAECRIMYNLKMNPGNNFCLNKCKVDTGVGSNLLPIGVYKHLGGNKNKLAKTIDRSLRPVAYNNTEIKQYGTCYITVQFKTKILETKFFVVDQTTTLIGLIDCIRLGLIMGNCFGSLSNLSNSEKSEIENHDSNDYFACKTDVKCQDKLVSDHFKMVILTEYRELFSGIGKLGDEIKITLESNAVSHITPVRRAAHSLQEPLKKRIRQTDTTRSYCSTGY